MATRGRGVHVVVIIDLSRKTGLYLGRLRSRRSRTRKGYDIYDEDKCIHQNFPYKRRNSIHSEGVPQTPLQKNEPQTFLSDEKVISHVPEEKNALYLADVGCGFPTLKAVNLRLDIGKVFVECGLEYCLVKKGQRFIRMHRTGDCIPEGEEVMTYCRMF